MTIANQESFNLVIKATRGQLYNLAGPRNADLRVGLMQFMTGVKHSKAKSGINKVMEELCKYTDAPKNVCQAAVNDHIYQTIINNKINKDVSN